MGSQPNFRIIETFIASAREAAAIVELIPAGVGHLSDALIKATAGRPLLLCLDEYLEQEWYSVFSRGQNVVTSPSKNQLSGIDTGITGAFCGIASTGSVCISISQNLSSPISMLVRRHIVILDGRRIVPKPRDVFSEAHLGGKGLRCSFSIITGPSATADMGPLVRGVHGPGELHIIILGWPDEQH